MFIDRARNLITTVVRRSGTQLDEYRSGDAPLLRTEVRERVAFRGYKHPTPNGVKSEIPL